MEYVVTDWLGHPNVHCPFCPYATVSPDGQQVVEQHVTFAHPTQLREALVAEMAASDAEARENMTKPQLLELAGVLEVGGLTTRSTRAEIEAAIAAKQKEQAAAALTDAEATTNGAPTAPEEE